MKSIMVTSDMSVILYESNYNWIMLNSIIT